MRCAQVGGEAATGVGERSVVTYTPPQVQLAEASTEVKHFQSAYTIDLNILNRVAVLSQAAAVALCERIARANSFSTKLDIDDWTEVAHLYSQLNAETFGEHRKSYIRAPRTAPGLTIYMRPCAVFPGDLAAAASPAVCLRVLHRLLRTLASPLLPPAAYQAVVRFRAS